MCTDHPHRPNRSPFLNRTASRLGQLLLALATAIMPPAQARWARAMEAEFHHLPQDHLSFAAGCLRSALMTAVLSGRPLWAVALTAVIAVMVLFQLASFVMVVARLTGGDVGAMGHLVVLYAVGLVLAASVLVSVIRPGARARLVLAGVFGLGLAWVAGVVAVASVMPLRTDGSLGLWLMALAVLGFLSLPQDRGDSAART
jgi:hypothetical protein